MPTREDEHEPDDDRDFPLDSDMDPDDDDGTDPCPHCHKPIFEDSEWCPHCGKYLSKEDAPVSRSFWVVTLVVILLIVFGLMMFRG